MEQHRNARPREMGDPRENPQTSGIARHDSHLRKSGNNRPRLNPICLGGRRARGISRSRLAKEQVCSPPATEKKLMKRRSSIHEAIVPVDEPILCTMVRDRENVASLTHSPVSTRATDVCSLAVAPVLPHTWQYGIRYLFLRKFAIGSEAYRACLTNCNPIAKRASKPIIACFFLEVLNLQSNAVIFNDPGEPFVSVRVQAVSTAFERWPCDVPHSHARTLALRCSSLTRANFGAMFLTHTRGRWPCDVPHSHVRTLALRCSSLTRANVGLAMFLTHTRGRWSCDVPHSHARTLALRCSSLTRADVGLAMFLTHTRERWPCDVPHSHARTLALRCSSLTRADGEKNSISRNTSFNLAGLRLLFPIWAALNIEVLRANEGEVKVSMEQRRNAEAEETGDPRANPPTNGIVRHDSRSG
ncbi:hypothetical protein PR048_022820 [Dryococelus australis]|uniref:Uncharacterized protein n=1 Tax=Dryococelus australis TaxID=614101 RepID=A0ABQ9GSB0_9NEOP|nr:hypothetical protein PR048_022820 [Dryococelus australis]